MKFQTYRTRSIFDPGRLKELHDQIYQGLPVKEVSQLSTDDLAKIPELYSTLDLSSLDITAIDPEAEFKTANGNTIRGEDLSAITILMYDKPRTAYVKYGKETQVHHTIYSGATPLPLLGFRRFRNISYDRWRVLFYKENPETGIDIEKWKWHAPNDDAIKLAFKLDLLLGKTLASTYYDTTDNCIKWKEKFGLIQMSSLTHKFWDINEETIRFLREAGFGAHRGNWATAWGTASIKETELPKGIDKLHVQLWNRLDNPLRLLLARRWAWYDTHRCSEMICDWRNWDNMPPLMDTVSTSFKGLTPKTGAGIQGLMGLKL